MAVIAALTVAALAPALVVSMMLTQNTLDHIDSTENAEVTDVTDVDPEATVMYTVSNSGRRPPTTQMSNSLQISQIHCETAT